MTKQYVLHDCLTEHDYTLSGTQTFGRNSQERDLVIPFRSESSGIERYDSVLIRIAEVMSRLHGNIKCNGDVYVTDLSSRGTWINEKKLQKFVPTKIEPGNRIILGGSYALNPSDFPLSDETKKILYDELDGKSFDPIDPVKDKLSLYIREIDPETKKGQKRTAELRYQIGLLNNFQKKLRTGGYPLELRVDDVNDALLDTENTLTSLTHPQTQ